MENNKVKILAIDDNADNLITLKAVIHEVFPDSEVSTALDGKTGIELALLTDPDVILLDIIMPDVDGFEVCKQIKANPKLFSTPVVFLTAIKGDKLNRIKALEVGAEGFLSKPIEETELVAQVRAMLKIKAANRSKENENELLTSLVLDKTKEIREKNIALKESEAKFREIIETTNDIHYRQNIETLEIEYISPSIEYILGFKIDEIKQMNLKSRLNLFHPDYITDLPDFKTEIINANLRGENHIEREFKIITKNGDAKWVNANYHITTNEKKIPIYILGVLRDISDKKKNEEDLVHNNLRLKSIINILQSKNNTIQEFLDFSLNEAIKLTNSKLGYIYWYNHKKQEFILNSWSKDVMKECDVLNPQTCYELEKTGIWGEAVRQRKPIIVNDFKAHNPLKKGFPEGHVALTSFMTIPIFNHDEIIGVVGVANKTTDYNENDVLQLTLLMNSVWKESERKTAQEQYEKLFSEMFDGFALHEIILDENGKTINYKFLDVNPAFEKLTGLKREDIIGKTILEVMPNTEEYWIEKYGEVALSGNPILYDNFAVEIGKYFEVRAFQPAPNQFATIISDISYRKRNEEKSKVQFNIASAMVTASDINELYATVRKELSKLIDTTNFYIALYDNQTNMLSAPYEIDVNDDMVSEWSADKSLTGLVVKSRKSMLFKKDEILKLAEEGEVELIGSRAECWLGVPLQIDEKVIGAIVIQSYDNPNAYDSESINILEIIAHELSIFIEKKKTEEQLIISKEKAEESDRLKTAFLQNMSHEIRTPLNGILGFASLLNDDDIDNEDVRKYASYIQNSGNRLFELINNIIDISKIETGNISIVENEFSVNYTINEILGQFLIFAQNKNILLRKSYNPSDDIIIISDSLKFHQILTNLINNALKFTEEGYIEIGYQIVNNNIVFSVKDTGSGISKEKGERIFERFFQGETSMSRGFEGAGLGLAICQGLAKSLNGNIWFESEIGKGSTFYFEIPYIKGELKQYEIDNNNIHINMKKNTILVAEDDDTSYSLMEMIFNKENINIIRAINGVEAVEIFKSRHDISCILMDIKMPKMNGIEATREIKAYNPDIPIIAQTAYAFQTERQQVIDAGCDDYLSKPISRNLLLQIIDKHMLRN